MARLRLLAASALVSVAALDAGAQGQPMPSGQAAPAPQRQPVIPRVAQSTRASVEALINVRMIGGNWMPAAGIAGPARIAIDYGQPHARGRAVIGLKDVVPWDTAWRSGANMATQLTTEVDITIGNTFVPRGIYTLYSYPGRNGWKLIINRQVLQWGTDYDSRLDLARIDLRSRTLAEPMETLTYWLVPAVEAPPSTTLPHGVLKFAWGNVELATDWRVGR